MRDQSLKFTTRFGSAPPSSSPSPSDYSFASPWQAIHPEHVVGLTEELQRELPSGHVLAGIVAVPIGHRSDADDVLFRVGDPPHRFAIVHLTFARETNPKWPSTEIYDTFEQFTAEAMRPAEEEFE
jgi:hypothetical protein